MAATLMSSDIATWALGGQTAPTSGWRRAGLAQLGKRILQRQNVDSWGAWEVRSRAAERTWAGVETLPRLHQQHRSPPTHCFAAGSLGETEAGVWGRALLQGWGTEPSHCLLPAPAPCSSGCLCGRSKG